MPRIFLFCGEILSILIRNNISIKGITIENVEHKLTQFADDTTLFLDGTKESLQAALNTLEIFGSFSGLKMNVEKTKVIWIGRRNNSNEKLKISTKLSWGGNSFSLLGIDYTTKIDDMTEINFNKTLETCKIILRNWKKRNLTPIGKITVIKTFIISKFTHLFTSLPCPNITLIKKLNHMIFDFIWDGKPDKISRKLITQPTNVGGLALTNVELFIKSLKITWLRKIFKIDRIAWKTILDPHSHLINNLSTFGPLYCLQLIDKTDNPFWKDVFRAWITFNVQYYDNKPNHTDILHNTLWYNNALSTEPFYLRNWHVKGINFVSDVINDQGQVMNMGELFTNHGLIIKNFLEYMKFKDLISKFLKKVEYNEQNYQKDFICPILPSHIKIIFKNSKGIKDMYNCMNVNDNYMPKFKEKWNVDLALQIDHRSWLSAFKICIPVVSI